MSNVPRHLNTLIGEFTSGTDPPMSELHIQLLLLYGPRLSFEELMRVTKVGRSKAHELMSRTHPKRDPTFPQGSPLYDAQNSPKIFSTKQAAKWLEAREEKQLNFQ